jgi:hypothetical protein
VHLPSKCAKEAQAPLHNRIPTNINRPTQNMIIQSIIKEEKLQTSNHTISFLLNNKVIEEERE